MARHTCRDFFDTSVSILSLATILYGTLADKKETDYDAPTGAQKFGFRRTSPSAGGLQATEGYVWVRNVEDLAPGIYHYISEQHTLEKVRDLPPEVISTYLCGQHWANNLAFAIFLLLALTSSGGNTPTPAPIAQCCWTLDIYHKQQIY